MPEEHGPPSFQPPTPPSRRLGDVEWRTFGWSLFLIVTFAVVAGLFLFFEVVARVLSVSS